MRFGLSPYDRMGCPVPEDPEGLRRPSEGAPYPHDRAHSSAMPSIRLMERFGGLGGTRIPLCPRSSLVAPIRAGYRHSEQSRYNDVLGVG